MYKVEDKKEYYIVEQLVAQNEKEYYEYGNHDVISITMIKKDRLYENTIECLKEEIERRFDDKDITIIWE